MEHRVDLDLAQIHAAAQSVVAPVAHFEKLLSLLAREITELRRERDELRQQLSKVQSNGASATA